MSLFVLTRASLVAACVPGLDQHAARALKQQGVDFGAGVVGNGVDTYYPDGFTDADWLRIAQANATHAVWMVRKCSALGLPVPSGAMLVQITALRADQRRGGA